MRSTRDILRKIRTVQSIEQITRAMKTVASIRLRRAEQRLHRVRPYGGELSHLVARIASVTQEHPYLQPRTVRRTAVVLVTSDRGLAGGYNIAAVRQAVTAGPPPEVGVVAIGRKGLGQMTRRGYQIIDEIAPLGGEPNAQVVWRLAGRIGAKYVAGEIDRVVLVYARFMGGASYRVRSDVLLPVPTEAADLGYTIFEPDPKQLLAGLMDRYLRTALLGAVLEASTSEHAARVAAMTAATDNAEEMIQDLTMDYNKARQAGITRELIEIVSGAEATA
jgi:F-type H+-transporting ATPase subunit gamma